MRSALLSAVGVLASLGFIAASMTMNYLYGIGLGRNALESQIWGGVSIASDALKAVSPIFLFWACRNRRWGTSAVCLVVLVATTGYALQSAAGFASETKSSVIGGRESVRAVYLEIEQELNGAVQRREAIKVDRSPEEFEAAISAALSLVIRDEVRARGTVGSVSVNCTRGDARTADACLEIGRLRQGLAAAAAAKRLDEQISNLRRQTRELRDRGGSSDPHPQATLLSWLTLGRLRAADIEAGKSIYLALLVELASAFGLLISIEHGELRKAWNTGSLVRRWRKAEPAEAPSSPSAPGGVGDFLKACLVPARGSELEVGDLYVGYRGWCGRVGKEALAVDRFGEEFSGMCERLGVQTLARGTEVFCLDVKLVGFGE